MRAGENGGISLSLNYLGFLNEKRFVFISFRRSIFDRKGSVRVVAKEKKASIPTTMVAGISHSSIIGWVELLLGAGPHRISLPLMGVPLRSLGPRGWDKGRDNCLNGKKKNNKRLAQAGESNPQLTSQHTQLFLYEHVHHQRTYSETAA